MLFHFSGEIETQNLLEEVRPLIQVLIDAGVTQLSDMYISARGFSGDTECQIVDGDGLISDLTFAARPPGRHPTAAQRVLRSEGKQIRKRPKDMPYGGLGTFFSHND